MRTLSNLLALDVFTCISIGPHWTRIIAHSYKTHLGTQHNVSYTKRVNGRYTSWIKVLLHFMKPWAPGGETRPMVLERILSPGSAVYHLSLDLSLSIFIKWESRPRWHFWSIQIPDTILFLSGPECLQGLELEGMKVVCGSSCEHVHVSVCRERRCD